MAIVLARVGMEYWRKPPSGYVCHGCNVPRHFIQHCPTNGDPNYDIKKVKPPRSSVGVLKTNEAAFLKERANAVSVSSINAQGIILSPTLFAYVALEPRNILADVLLPNLTLRVTTNRILDSVPIVLQSMGSVLTIPQPKIPFPSESLSSLPP
ncbi:hypothetical protein HAX54_004423 [Datura stramonium]|uniref:Zinc knuckle CX2CX3GHX4C domain-containing protein n=1 Tax=Datura stramonium TaxID=4076 RepID=A0ABS8T8A6_DATST|nr:hypothetical protein [Datura stramonium]